MKKILDIRITRDRKNRLLRMNQTHYLKKILEELKMKSERNKFIETLMNEYDVIKFFSSTNLRINVKEYQHAIEKIMYAAVHTRSDIAYATERLNQFLSDSAKQHDENLKHLLRYIRFTINLELMFEDNENSKVIEYFDSDYVSDKSDRKSILEYIYMLRDESIV